MTDTVLVRREGDIATVTLNRPEKLNALNHATWLTLRDTMREMDADGTLRCVVLRGAGGEGVGAWETAGAGDPRVPGRSSRFGVPINRLGLTMAYPELQWFVATFGRVAGRGLLVEGGVAWGERGCARG